MCRWKLPGGLINRGHVNPRFDSAGVLVVPKMRMKMNKLSAREKPQVPTSALGLEPPSQYLLVHLAS